MSDHLLLSNFVEQRFPIVHLGKVLIQCSSFGLIYSWMALEEVMWLFHSLLHLEVQPRAKPVADTGCFVGMGIESHTILMQQLFIIFEDVNQTHISKKAD